MAAFVAPAAWYGGAPLAFVPAQHVPVSADYSYGQQNQFPTTGTHSTMSSRSSNSFTPPMIIPPPAPKLSAAAAASIGSRAAYFLNAYAGYQQGHVAAPASTAYTHPANNVVHPYIQHQAAMQVPSHAQHHQHLEHQLLLAAQLAKQDPHSLADMPCIASHPAPPHTVPHSWSLQSFSHGAVPSVPLGLGSSSLYGGLQPACMLPVSYFETLQPWSSAAGVRPEHLDTQARQQAAGHSENHDESWRIATEQISSKPASPSRAASSAHSAVPFAGVACALLMRLSEALVSLQSTSGSDADASSLNAYHDLSSLIAPVQNSASSASEIRECLPGAQEQNHQIFLQFAAQVFSQTMVSPSAMFLALHYALQLPSLLHSSSPATKEEYVRIFTQPASSTPFKLLVLGLMIANKHLDDNTFLNRTWHEVTGIPLEELNQMERFYLSLINFDISPSPLAWSTHISRLQHFFNHHLGLLDDHAIEFSFSRILRHFEVSQKTLQKLLEALKDSDPTSGSSRNNQKNGPSPALAPSQTAQAPQRRRPSLGHSKSSSSYGPILSAYNASRAFPGNFGHFHAPLAAA